MDDSPDWRDVADEIEIELVVERRVDRIRRADHEERITVWRCAHHRFGGNIATCAWPVLDDERLAEPF
jgi:hypothetical protein